MIADHLTLADVTRVDLPGLTQMRRNGQLALMSPGLPQGADPIANVYATLGAGDSIRVGDVSQGRMASALRQAGLRTTLIGNADGDDTGTDRPALSFFPSPDVVTADDGTVPDPMAPGGKRIDPVRLWTQTQAGLRGSDLVVVHFGDFARLERENQQGDFVPTAYQAHRERALRALSDYLGLASGGQRAGGSRPLWLFLVTPTSLLDSRGHWNRLTPYLQWPQWPPQAGRKVSLFALSDTTQTVGLVAARDFAPTLLNALGVTPPIQMTGAVIQPVSSAPEEAALRAVPRLDTMTRLNQEVQNPLFWGLGFLAAATLGVGLALYLSGVMARDGRARKFCCYGLRLLSAWPLALLIAPLFLPASVGAYLGVIGALTALIALLPSPAVIFSLTTLVLVIDGLTGTMLVSQSVLSAYALSGIRFYGIGNEYMGVLLGGTLLAASLMRPRGPLLLFAMVIFVLSFPEFGAKAGGAITATATFTVAYLRLRGRAVTGKHLLGSLLAGFALVFVWAVVGHWLGSRRTHIDSAVDAVFEGRFGYIAGVAWRKVGLAVRVLLHPGTLLGLVALLGVGAALRAFLARQVRDYLTRHPRFAAVWGAGLWGCVVALFVNDSGVVAAILLLACLLPALLHGLYKECESLPSTWETSASALPSATP